MTLRPSISSAALRRLLGLGLSLVPLLTVDASQSLAQSTNCTRADIAAAVDKAGAVLRAVNMETMPRIQSKMRELKALKGWSETEYQEQASALITDERSSGLDNRGYELLNRIDSLGSPPAGAPVDCATIADIEAASLELSATMRAKSSYTLERLDALLAAAAPPGAAPARPRSAQAPAAPKPAPRAETKPPEPKVALQSPPPAQPPPPAVEQRSVQPPAAQPGVGPAQPSSSAWSSTTTQPPAPQASAGVPPSVFVPPPEQEGYTIEEIREATRGFFGQISTGLASVIEYVFRRSGRPAGYVLGNEGGGAFLAGLRYGEGTLFLRSGGQRRVYWHGPSVGYDFGVTGSKTMFLVYNLQQEEDLFARFTGIDGSAYLIGGVGVTFLTNGRVVMAPIRSGLGLRIGANVGYVRFTEKATWNPF